MNLDITKIVRIWDYCKTSKSFKPKEIVKAFSEFRQTSVNDYLRLLWHLGLLKKEGKGKDFMYYPQYYTSEPIEY